MTSSNRKWAHSTQHWPLRAMRRRLVGRWRLQNTSPLVAKHEAVLKPALARAFDTPWEKHPIHVEMSYYVTNASAYTAIFPTLITVSSSSSRTVGPAMIEVLFHE